MINYHQDQMLGLTFLTFTFAVYTWMLWWILTHPTPELDAEDGSWYDREL